MRRRTSNSIKLQAGIDHFSKLLALVHLEQSVILIDSNRGERTKSLAGPAVFQTEQHCGNISSLFSGHAFGVERVDDFLVCNVTDESIFLEVKEFARFIAIVYIVLDHFRGLL